VWAVAFACVIAFMGLGLVDPILPSLAKDLHARPSQVELLFSSYILVMGVAMLITSTISSRFGAKRTLLGGLALIVLFSAAPPPPRHCPPPPHRPSAFRYWHHCGH
jgi:MFS family permease